MKNFFTGGFAGIITGIYISQNYEVIDIKSFVNGFIRKVQEYEKNKRKEGDSVRYIQGCRHHCIVRRHSLALFCMSDNTPKNLVYVGGLDLSVTEGDLYTAFIPFGEIVATYLPRNQSTGKLQGFGYVEFENAEDAKNAIDNMNLTEFFGLVIRCNLAHNNSFKQY